MRRGGGKSGCESSRTSEPEGWSGEGERRDEGWDDRKRENMECIWVASSLERTYRKLEGWEEVHGRHPPCWTNHECTDLVFR